MLCISKQGAIMVDVEKVNGQYRVTFPWKDVIVFDSATFHTNFSKVENTSLRKRNHHD